MNQLIIETGAQLRDLSPVLPIFVYQAATIQSPITHISLDISTGDNQRIFDPIRASSHNHPANNDPTPVLILSSEHILDNHTGVPLDDEVVHGLQLGENNRRKYRQLQVLHEDAVGPAHLLLVTDYRKDGHCISYGVLRRCASLMNHTDQNYNVAHTDQNSVNEPTRSRSAV